MSYEFRRMATTSLGLNQLMVTEKNPVKHKDTIDRKTIELVTPMLDHHGSTFVTLDVATPDKFAVAFGFRLTLDGSIASTATEVPTAV